MNDQLTTEIRRFVSAVADVAPAAPPTAGLRERSGRASTPRRNATVTVAAGLLAVTGVAGIGWVTMSRPEQPKTGAGGPAVVSTPSVSSEQPGTSSSSVASPVTTAPDGGGVATPNVTASGESTSAADPSLRMLIPPELPEGFTGSHQLTVPAREFSEMPPHMQVYGSWDGGAPTDVIRAVTAGQDSDCGPAIEPIEGHIAQWCSDTYSPDILAVKVNGVVRLFTGGSNVSKERLIAFANSEFVGKPSDPLLFDTDHPTDNAEATETGYSLAHALPGPTFNVRVWSGMPDATILAATASTVAFERIIGGGRRALISSTPGSEPSLAWIERPGQVVSIESQGSTTVDELVAFAESLVRVDEAQWEAFAGQLEVRIPNLALPLDTAGHSLRLVRFSDNWHSLSFEEDSTVTSDIFRFDFVAAFGNLADVAGRWPTSLQLRPSGCLDLTVSGHPAELYLDPWGAPAIAWQLDVGLVLTLNSASRPVPGVVYSPQALVSLAEGVSLMRTIDMSRDAVGRSSSEAGYLDQLQAPSPPSALTSPPEPTSPVSVDCSQLG